MVFGSSALCFFLLLLASSSSLFHPARSDDADSQLLQGINSYRASLNLSALTENKNAACLAEQIVGQFKDQPCTNSTGSNTVPGTEQQFPNYPDFLDHCHLNTSDTQDSAILPACVPGLDSTLVLSNFTKSQYLQYLNGSQYVGAGISSEGNWIVAVLSTNTPQGSFASSTSASSVVRISLFYPLLSFLLGSLMVIMC